MATPTDLELAVERLTAKVSLQKRLWDYYDGDHPIVYSTKKLREEFGSKFDVCWNLNYCGFVVSTYLPRIQLTGFRAPDNESASQVIQEVARRSRVLEIAPDIHEAFLVTGEAFVIAEEGPSGWRFYANDPRLVEVIYDDSNPTEKRFAAKWWRNGPRYSLNLYYSDRIEKYETNPIDKTKGIPQAKDFYPVPMGEVEPWNLPIPVFRACLTRRRLKSVLDDLIPIQDAVNKLFADLMITSESAAIGERYVVTSAELTGGVKRGSLVTIPAGDRETTENTQVGQFESADLGQYLKSLADLRAQIATISGVPVHLLTHDTGANISGEALMALESPLKARAQTFQDILTPFWTEVMTYGGGVSDRVEPVFAPAGQILPRTQAEIRDINARAGIPIEVQLQQEGWAQEDLAKVIEANGETPNPNA